MYKISEKDIDKTFASWYDRFNDRMQMIEEVWEENKEPLHEKRARLCEKEKSDEISDEI